MEIGAVEAIITKVTTLIDGGTRISLDLNSQDYQIAQKLLQLYSQGEPSVTVAFVRGEVRQDLPNIRIPGE